MFGWVNHGSSTGLPAITSDPEPDDPHHPPSPNQLSHHLHPHQRQHRHSSLKKHRRKCSTHQRAESVTQLSRHDSSQNSGEISSIR